MRFQRKARHVDHIVEEANGYPGQPGQFGLIETCFLGERMGDELGEIDRAQKARAIGRQGLLAAGIGGVDGFAIGQVVERVHAVDEDHTGLGRIVGRAHDAIP